MVLRRPALEPGEVIRETSDTQEGTAQLRAPGAPFQEPHVNFAKGTVAATIGILAVLAASSISGCPPVSAPGDSSLTSASEVIFDNGNVGLVAKSPTAAATFTTQRTYRVTLIRNYHWNDGAGSASVGTVALRDAAGTTYGPWPAVGNDGGGDSSKNLYWEAAPDTLIPPGTYTVIDSDPATWAQNAATGNAGMTHVEGVRITTGGDDGTSGDGDTDPNTGDGDGDGEPTDGSSDDGAPVDLQRIHTVQVILDNADLLWESYNCEGTSSTHYAPLVDMYLGIEGRSMWDFSHELVWSDHTFSGEDEYMQVSGRFSDDWTTLLELSFVAKQVPNPGGWMVQPPFDQARRNITILNLPLQAGRSSDTLVGYAGVDHPENGSASGHVDLDVALVYTSCVHGHGGSLDYWPQWTVLPLDTKWDNANVSVYIGP
jgi:hypothetical protein